MVTGATADWSLATQQRAFDHVESTLLLAQYLFSLPTTKCTSVHMALITYSVLYPAVHMSRRLSWYWRACIF